MVIYRRARIVVLVLIFYIAAHLYTLDVEKFSFMQVETAVDVFYFQETGCVFTYDDEVMACLDGVTYSRFSVVTEDGEGVISGLFGELRYQEVVGGDVVCYYYSPLLASYVVVGGEKVNLQVGFSGGVYTIGYPMIDIGF